MRILALENSTVRGSIAFVEDDKDPILLEFANDRKHSGEFFRALESLSPQLSKLDSIVIGLGPGSYAGIRIAISTGMGLQRASSARLVGIPSVCALSGGQGEYGVIGDARRESFFFVRICANRIVQDFRLYDQIELARQLERLDTGMPLYCFEVLSQFEGASLRYPSAAVLAQLVRDGVVDPLPAPLQPIYLRPPHITTPNNPPGKVS